ncbi:MAG: hypothetical protein ACO1SV_05260 [Fimbriimonas sp.]
MRLTRPVLLPFALMALASLGRAEIGYRLTPLPETKRVRIEMTIPVKGGEATVQMPRWHPGWYYFQSQVREIRDFGAIDGSGNRLTSVPVDDHTWRLSGGKDGTVRVAYTLPVEVNAGGWGIDGPNVYMYVVDRKDEECRLTLDLPVGWRAAIGLPGKGPEYRAPSYDVLADNPITTGQYRETLYTVGGKEHILAFSGPERDAVDAKAVAKICQQITETQTSFFGGIPYDKYVWHFQVFDGGDGAGGLEHLTSTQIGFGKRFGWRTTGVFSHEFFHLWNVKRIRSKPLGPFDYQKIPKTGALWWLEGVTDYYSGLLLRRGGLYDDKTFFDHVLSSVRPQRANPARLTVSPYDSSFRVGEANGGRGSASGYKVSYYDTGYLAGLVLDLELRHRTDGKHSLDDVEKALWNRFRSNEKEGFDEDEIRRQIVLLGGDSMGAFYDRIVMKPGELPLEAAFAHVGITLTRTTVDGKAQGPWQLAVNPNATPDQLRLREGWLSKQGKTPARK